MNRAPDTGLADPQQIIADLQRQLDERTAERDALRRQLTDTVEQQRATTEVLSVINSSTGNLSPVFDLILEKAVCQCEFDFALLWVLEGELFRAGASYGAPQSYADFLASAITRPFPGTVLGLIADGDEVVHVADVLPLAAYHGENAAGRALIELGKARTVMGVALRKDGKLLGVITAYRQEVHPFTAEQIALLKNFAAQAVIAMENARLITETREALEQQTATAEVLGVINSSPGDLAPVFDAILEKAHTLCEAAFGSLMTVHANHFRAVAVRGVPERFAAVLEAGFDASPRNPVATALLGGAPYLHIPDMAEAAANASPDDPIPRQGYELGGVRTLLVVPLRKDSVVLGLIAAYRQQVRPFTDKQIGLLQNFAAQAVIAMENARLLTETREALEQQQAITEILQVINRSPGELQPVFNVLLERAMQLCGAAFGILAMLDREEARTVASLGVPAALAEWRQTHPVINSRNTLLVRVLAGEPYVHSLDLKDDDLYRKGEPLRRANVDLGGARSSLYVPMLRDRDVLGTIHIYRQEVQPFTDKQIALLQNFAAQAVIAMENARLLGELHQRTDEVAALNRGLEARVAEQVEELGRVGRLKRFLAPQLAELIVSQGDEKILESHRRDIVVVFCDLRGYTAFTETAEPEEVLDFLREYHGVLGPLVSQFEGTLDQFSGDGIMVLFNDPVPCPDPAERAVMMAMAMREEAGKLIATWRRDGCELGFGVGIAQGYATLGQIGFAERSGYTAIGTVCNLAARLCAEAQDGQILISSRVARAVDAVARLEELGNLELKGLRRPVAAFNVAQSVSPAETRPNLTVVARGPRD